EADFGATVLGADAATADGVAAGCRPSSLPMPRTKSWTRSQDHEIMIGCGRYEGMAVLSKSNRSFHAGAPGGV
ncbi:MAG: hypothetical protein ACJ8FY_28625, partial [Gemmataceae bacterium]